jgi:hypothetical protein
VFPARYELNSYIVFRKRLVSKRLRDNSALPCPVLSLPICCVTVESRLRNGRWKNKDCIVRLHVFPVYIPSYSLVKIHICFGGTCRLYFQGSILS